MSISLSSSSSSSSSASRLVFASLRLSWPRSASSLPARTISTRSAAGSEEADVGRRTIFVRPSDGGLPSLLYALAIVHSLAKRWGPVQKFYFGREPDQQRFLGFGSITFERTASVAALLRAGDFHRVPRPPRHVSIPPTSYLSPASTARLSIGPQSPDRPVQEALVRGESYAGPASERPGLRDLAPYLGLQLLPDEMGDAPRSTANNREGSDELARTEEGHEESSEPYADEFFEVKVERRSSALKARHAPTLRNPNFAPRPTDAQLRAALELFDGFKGGLARGEAPERPDKW